MTVRRVNWEFIRDVGLFAWVSRTTRWQLCKRLIHKDPILRLPDGSRVILPTESSSASEVFVTNGNCDWGADQVFSSFASPTRDAIDVGAHIGYYSARVARGSRRVVAIEPNATNLKWLRLNAELNNNIEIVAAVATDTPGTRQFNVSSNTATGSVEGEKSASSFEVPAVTIDGLVAEHDLLPRLIKVDAEGHDLSVLRGATQTLGAYRPLVLTEAKPTIGLAELCSTAGYRIWSFTKPLAGGKARFEESWPLPPGRKTKMLFLAHARDVDTLQERAHGRMNSSS